MTHYLKAKNTGFTLIEIMVTVAILSLGIIILHQSFFTLLSSTDFLTNRLSAGLEANNKIWEIQEGLKFSGGLKDIPGAGRIVHNGRNFYWKFLYNTLSESSGLYKIELFLSWMEGAREKNFIKDVYILKPQ